MVQEVDFCLELIVYTWGEGSRGQLGHGDCTPWKNTPQPVEALRGKSIKVIAAGDGYSVFVSDSGMLMTCGDGTFGCLGHGDWNNFARPRLIGKYQLFILILRYRSFN